MAFDPWAQYNQGLQTLGNDITTLKNQQMLQQENARRSSLQDLQMQQAQAEIADTQAKQAATQQLHGATTLQEAYLAQMKATKVNQEAEKEIKLLAGAKEVANIYGDKAAVYWYNKNTGNNLEYTGKKEDWIIVTDKDTGAIHAFNPKSFDPTNPQASFQVLKPGTPKIERDKPLAQIVKDSKSPTGYSYLTEQGNMIQNAIQPKSEKPVSVSVRTGSNLDAKGDYEERKVALKELPALRKDAEAAKLALSRADRMIQMIDNGNAGGITSTMKAILAPILPESKNMNEAALFQTFARMAAGPYRTAIIGTGPQTEKEGTLLFQIGGGGTQGRKALRDLMDIHKTNYVSKLDEYNTMVDAAKTKIYKPINYGNNAPVDQSSTQPLSIGGYTVKVKGAK